MDFSGNTTLKIYIGLVVTFLSSLIFGFGYLAATLINYVF